MRAPLASCAAILRLALALSTGLGCERGAASERRAPDLRSQSLHNRIAYIPPQCFTRVTDDSGAGAVAQNPCYVCHAQAREPNMQSQPELQLAYDFPQVRAGAPVQNPWSNSFRDRTAQVAAISDDAVRRYVAQDNYGYAARQSKIAQRLAALPVAWDADENGRWDGYVPDAHFSYDARGFDRGPDGTPSGFRVFAYYPLPGGFMPANGSFDDVLIRLPEAFRQNDAGAEDLQTYELNLAIVEALIRRRDVPIDPTDESRYGVDVDGDGRLGRATHVRFAFDPRSPSASLQYVGRAGQLHRSGALHLAPGLFPEGTEFLHSVRYLALDEQGAVRAAPRMKELRYAKKHSWLSYAQLADHAQREAKEAALNPDRPEQFYGDGERGVHNASGWVLAAFIEDESGQLRPQTYEETVFCMGCHGGLSATEDSTFAFARKLSSGPAHGYYAPQWGAGQPLPDPTRDDGQPEYATYLRLNREGDSYRSNQELLARFYDASGAPRAQAFARLAQDVAPLWLPSAARALTLDKAYWIIVKEQSFVAGRDPVVSGLSNVLREVRSRAPTGIAQAEAAPRLRL